MVPRLDTPPPNPAGRRVMGMRWERVRPTSTQANVQAARPEDTAELPNDLQVDQWGLRNTQGGPDINVRDAWRISKGDSSENGPLIAFFDTGIDLEHPDLRANIWTNPGETPDNGVDDDGNGVIDDVHGFEAVTSSGDPSDDADHGTHTAGIAAAVGNNGIGITGVMPNARIMPVKIFLQGWIGPDEAVGRGMAYARKMGAKIVSHSWGGGPYTKIVEQAFRSFPEALHIVAAGNRGTDNDTNDYFPGNFDLDNVLVVAASDRHDHKLGISQYGATNVDVAAPGEEILSTIRGGRYDKRSATSFATPHVTGIAGLIASVYPDLTATQIKDRILFSSDRIPALRDVSLSGGRVNAASALEDDRLAPGAPRDFRVEPGRDGKVRVAWLTPADDGERGGSARVEVRVSSSPISEDTYRDAMPYLTPDLTKVGQPDFVELVGDGSSPTGPLYFAARAIDNVGNRSAMVTTTLLLP